MANGLAAEQSFTALHVVPHIQQTSAADVGVTVVRVPALCSPRAVANIVAIDALLLNVAP